MVCDKCDGEGLLGAGDFPKLRHGSLNVCDKCKGNGKTEDVAPVEPPVVPAEPTPSE